MRRTGIMLAGLALTMSMATPYQAQQRGAANAAAAPAADDPIKTMVGRLDLEKYKATVKGLTQFGDRRQGTERNRKAIDWIEAQLKSYGCSNTERIRYIYPAPNTNANNNANANNRGGAAGGGAAAGGANAAGGGAGRGGGGRGNPAPQVGRVGEPNVATTGPGGSVFRGIVTRTGVNNDPMQQKDVRLRELNMEPAPTDSDGRPLPSPREEVFCTKIGTTHPEEMYIVGGHMDGHGWGEAANDDGSGTALVMELARIFSMPDVQTERSIRFILWNNEETGTNGARAYIDQRVELQGKENPPGSRRYPEPKWLGMIQHDMMMFDHGMPLPDGTIPKEQRPEADVNIEFQMNSKMAAQSMDLAWKFKAANEKYALDYPAAVGPHMTNTDSGPFQDLIPAISLRENERGAQVGSGWDPQWHQVTDVFTTYSDKDFRLGLNAAMTTLGAIATLTNATLKK